MIMTQKKHFYSIFFPVKTSTANQNTLDFKKLKHLKQQMIKLQCVLTINRMLSSFGVNANIVTLITIFIVCGVNRP